MKKLTLLLVIFTSIIIEINSQSIAGTWVYSGGNMQLTLLLYPNGTGEFQGMPIKYKVQNGQLYLDDGINPVSYAYKLSQNTLVLSGGGMQVAVTFQRPVSAGDSGPSEINNPVQQQQANQFQNQGNINSSNAPGTDQSGKTLSGMAGVTSSGQGVKGSSGITGVWEGAQGKIVFYPDGSMFYNNVSYQYSVSGNQLLISGSDGNVAFGYSQSGNSLTLSQNASSAQYTRTTALRSDVIDPQLAGKWCIVSSNYNSYSGGGSSSEECITLNADGTYNYFYSASRSAYSYDQSAYGGNSNQNNDNGTWKTDGQTIVSVSAITGKTSRYSLQKQNNENGDPMIIIGGKKFVTAYNRPRW